MIYDGLIDAFNNYHMGVTAENVAEKFKITREEQDMFALNSQKKTQIAFNKKKFDEEIISINQNGNIIEKDERQKQFNISDLENLKLYSKNGTLHRCYQE